LLSNGDQKGEVLALYTEALDAYPQNHELLYARALAAAELGRIAELEQDLRVILQDNPKHADALNALGYTLADQTDRYQEALEYIERALELKPNNPAVLDSMGWVQYRLGNYEKALQYLQRANQMHSDSEIAAHLGEVLWVVGDKDQARQVWQRALELDPDSSHLQDALRRFR
jgi:Flp pilus assembly protein TadD